ncbi:MAG: hypothetical protein ACE5HY_02880, partial [Candidatus Hydrothermarchaeales archaeon]
MGKRKRYKKMSKKEAEEEGSKNTVILAVVVILLIVVVGYAVKGEDSTSTKPRVFPDFVYTSSKS